MNDIERKPFLIFKSRDSYEQAKAREEVRDDAIVFIREDGTIWTHGYMFGGAVEHAKGFFKSVDLLPSGIEGDWAIVKVDNGWYIYTYNSNTSLWEQTELYNIPSGPIDLDETYVRYDTIRDYLKDIYNNVYVRKDEVWSPEGWWSGVEPGSSSEQGEVVVPTYGGGSSIKVDDEMSAVSWNPVANNVIYRYIKKLEDSLKASIDQLKEPDDQQPVSYSEFESAMMEKVANTLTDYYTKSQTYSKTEVNRLVSLIPTYLTKVVLELPTNDNVEPNVIYIVKDPDNDTSFIEYIYDGEQWIELSRLINNISLDGYATEDWVLLYFCNTLDYYTKVEIDTNYYTKSQVDDKFDLTVKKADVYTPDSEEIPSKPIQNTPGSNPWRRALGPLTPIEDEQPISGSYVTFEQMQKYVREHAAEATTNNIPNHIILEQSTYEALTSYEDNTLYFVLEPRENINWTFGGTFPITFTDGEIIGTFPITLE